MMAVASPPVWIEDWLGTERTALPDSHDRDVLAGPSGERYVFDTRSGLSVQLDGCRSPGSELDRMRLRTDGLRSWIERVFGSLWVGLAYVLAMYWFVGAGLRSRPRGGSIGPFELLVLPAPAFMIAIAVMAVLMLRHAPVSERLWFQGWLRFMGMWLLLTTMIGGNLWLRYDPQARSHRFPPLVSPKVFLDSYLGVWKDLLK